METSAIDRKKMEIIAKAWANPEYMRQLLADPKKVVASEFAVDIPAGIDVKVLVDTPDTEHLVLVQPGFLPATDQPTVQMGVVYKAWTDPAFKAALLADPRKAFGDFLQFKLPDKPAIKVVEQTDSAFYIVIPQRPASLSDAELDQVAGGTSLQQKLTYGGAGAQIGIGVVGTVFGGPLLGGPLIASGVATLLTDSTVRQGISTAASAVGHGVSTAAHAVASGIKSIFHGW